MLKERGFFLLRFMRGQQKIRFGILGIFVGLLALSLFLTTTYTRWNIQSAVDVTSQDIINKTQKSIMDDTLAYFTPAMKIMQLGASVDTAVNTPILDNPPLFAFLLACFEALPQSSLIFAADEQGNLLSIGTLPEKRVYLYTLDKPIPHKSAYVVDIVDRRQGYKEWRSYVDAKGIELDREYRPLVSRELEYDNRKRDWYMRTKKLQKANWSDVYPSWFSPHFVVTATVPLRDKQGLFVGALACDIGVENLSVLLGRQKASRSGINYIVNNKNEVIAFPDVTRSSIRITDPVTDKETRRLAMVGELGEKALAKTYDIYQKTRKFHFRYEGDNIEYVAHFSQFPNVFSNEWTLGMLAPYDDFVGPIRETSKDVMMISILILLCSVVLLIVFSQKISYPIELLAGQMRRIKDLDLEVPPPVGSHFFEITQMENTLTTMRESLGAFSKFVPKTLVLRLIEKGGGVSLGGERRKLTIMFSDIEGFTSISEKMESDALMNHLSNYIGGLSDVIITHRGTIDKYIGDAVMAFWGAPEPDEQNPINASKAVLLCVRHLTIMNKKWEEQGLPRLNTRFGLDYGEVIVGNMGSKDRMNYTVIGDHVNLASRLEGINKLYKTTALVSDPVYQEIKDSFLTRPVDIVAVKGKEKGVRIHELIAQFSQDPDLQPTPMQEEWCALTQKAFQLYLDREWVKSKDIYLKILERKINDPVSLLYIERCDAFIAEPPPKDWDGVQHLHTK